MTIITTHATYQNHSLEIIVIGNEQWVKGVQVGEALGYSDPARSISRVHSRNSSNFDTSDTMVVELTTVTGMKLTRLYSHKGVAKIAMLANTPKAAAFRDWAAKTLTTPKPEPVLELTAGLSPYVTRDLATFWMKHKPNRLFVKYAHLPIARIDMARMCGWKTAGTVTSKRRVAEALGLIAPDKSLMPSPFARHVALQRAASASLALSSHA